MGRLRFCIAEEFPPCRLLLAVVLLLTTYMAFGQSSAELATLYGVVRDSKGHAIGSVSVHLHPLGAPELVLSTGSDGEYRCAQLRSGSYTLHVEKSGVGSATFGPFALSSREAKKIDLVLRPQDSANHPASGEFFDEPQFTVAGITDTMNHGGHGSDTVSRTSQSLAKDISALDSPKLPASTTLSPSRSAEEQSLRDALQHDPGSFEANYRLGLELSKLGRYGDAVPQLERAHQIKPEDRESTYELARTYADAGDYERARATVVALLATHDSAEVHHLLGDVEEKQSHPLQAVREYQRAAELEPSESNLFDWGAELLTHRALEPAMEVFTKGNRSFPRSARMMVGLGVAWYASGSADSAAKYVCAASDLDPTNPSPYLVLGKMQIVNSSQDAAILERLQRFASLRPDNALANYYYAIALKRSARRPETPDGPPQVEALLQKALQLDPKLAPARLQMGILWEERGDFRSAIREYQSAIEADPQSAEAHYRLAQTYRRTGEAAKAEAEIKLYEQISSKSSQDQERQAREIPQFVYTLRDSKSPARPR